MEVCMEAYGEIIAFMLLAVVTLVMSRLPKVEEVDHSPNSDGVESRTGCHWV